MGFTQFAFMELSMMWTFPGTHSVSPNASRAQRLTPPRNLAIDPPGVLTRVGPLYLSVTDKAEVVHPLNQVRILTLTKGF